MAQTAPSKGCCGYPPPQAARGVIRDVTKQDKRWAGGPSLPFPDVEHRGDQQVEPEEAATWGVGPKPHKPSMVCRCL